MTQGNRRRLDRLERVTGHAASRVIVVSDYGATDVQAEIARQGATPRDLVVVLRKWSGERP